MESAPKQVELVSPSSLSKSHEPKLVISSEDEPVQLPSRAISIPNVHLYDPLTYVSHSSKLNPENWVRGFNIDRPYICVVYLIETKR